MRCVAIRHVAFEDLGIWEAEITAHGYEIVYLDAGVDDLAPFAAAELGIVLGGPVGAGDVADYPVLAEEASLLAARVEAGRPTLAVCLGAQLLAHALGGSVAPGEPEVGWGSVDLAPAAADTPLRHLAGAPVLHWHGDAIVPPPAATVLASTPATPCQAFAIGSALALQFHPEVDAERIERWLIGHTGELRGMGIAPGDLRAASRAAGDDAAVAGILMVREWLRGWEGSWA
ncbi:glutamine amidotransferase-related protein [Demequina rhizosphaerae]|uniref:glutamine amidotransferase-related protein n=1 Tax=Demequina rhizosphaerae TaxID=1638985 RepID=UPI000784FEB2|nr:gamma-glutamyl-gamma-aminobutyrate hydrolase family protein [Demequina rhizosphaerae]